MCKYIFWFLFNDLVLIRIKSNLKNRNLNAVNVVETADHLSHHVVATPVSTSQQQQTVLDNNIQHLQQQQAQQQALSQSQYPSQPPPPQHLDYNYANQALTMSQAVGGRLTHLPSQNVSTDRRDQQVQSLYGTAAAVGTAAGYDLNQMHYQTNSMVGTKIEPTNGNEQTWAPRHLQRVSRIFRFALKTIKTKLTLESFLKTDAYPQGYNQMSSPSRSPSGPTYTQLNTAPAAVTNTRGNLVNQSTNELTIKFKSHYNLFI